MESTEILKIAANALNEKKAKELAAVKIDKLTVIAEYFLMCTATSSTHVRALADEVEEKLVGTKAYFDTAVVSKFMNIDLYKRIIDKHGDDRILYGSDGPWENPLETLEFLKISDVDKNQFELITYKNAKKLLNL